MHCPSCRESQLVMSERQGIEIDYCPQCRGVWLDRGELDKIIERSHQDNKPQRVQHHDEGRHSSHQNYPHHDSRRSSYKKKNFWEELFD